MAEEEKKEGKAEEVAEKTGALIGKGLKKTVSVTKALGRGAKDAVKRDEQK